MKKLLITLSVLLAILILLIAGLNLYFTDDRLRDMILPQVKEASGSDVQVENMSITFFKTFPRFGLELDGVTVPDQQNRPIATIDELVLSLELIPLFREEISLSQLSVSSPTVYYTVFADSTTNIDFLLETDEEPVADEAGYNISIPGFSLNNASIFYIDETSETQISLEQLNADISLFFGDLIETRFDADLGSLNASVGGTDYVTNLALSLNQTSELDLEQERINVTEGVFSIRGLALNFTGFASEWSSDAPDLSLQFSSASENFGELLRLAPPEFDEYLSGLETRGALALEGSIEGSISEETLPRFDFILNVADGYIQNPDLPEAIREINFQLEINNDLATLSQFRARAGENSVTASGTLNNPLEDDAEFSIELDGDINLATVGSFYPIGDLGIEQLAGLLRTNATATGRIDQPENAIFSGSFNLTEGVLKYADVPRPIEQINAQIQANQDRIEIAESGFTAADNRFRLSGSVLRPLDENNRSVDITADVNFDLATIKNFYPIDEDTLSMSGRLVSQVALRGKPDPDQIETLVQRGTVELTNGFLSHKSLTHPLEDVTFRAEASGRRLAIREARFINGENNLSMNGSVTDYLGDAPVVDLTFNGDAVLSSVANYYTLEPYIQELNGNAALNINSKGPVNDIMNIELNGSLEVSGVEAIGDSLFLPVTDLSGRMEVTPQQMNLERFSMMYGSSDISLNGSLRNYLGFMEENSTNQTRPSISGTYSSRFLNIDEMIDWEEESEEPLPIELPDLSASVDATINRLIIFGIPITEISGNGRITPTLISVEQAEATMFGGKAVGKMDWNVPAPLETNLTFNGRLDSLQAETFFRDTGFLGPKSTLHNYVTGSFSSQINYSTELTPLVEPDVTTTVAEGTFGMTKARMQGHPIQKKIAEFINAPELEQLTLDKWNANISIRDTVMTLKNFSITSGNLGIQLDGTLHMISDRINYKATLLLPERFKKGIASVISTRAADALQLEDGRLAVPVRITGTTENPQIRPDTDTIDGIIRDYIRDGAGNLINRLFGG